MSTTTGKQMRMVTVAHDDVDMLRVAQAVAGVSALWSDSGVAHQFADDLVAECVGALSSYGTTALALDLLRDEVAFVAYNYIYEEHGGFVMDEERHVQPLVDAVVGALPLRFEAE